MFSAKDECLFLKCKPFECNICSKTFVENIQLNQHVCVEKGHEAEKPSKCKICHQTFREKDLFY